MKGKVKDIYIKKKKNTTPENQNITHQFCFTTNIIVYKARDEEKR